MADTSRGRIALVPEATFGVTPTDPAFVIQRINSASLTYTKDTSESNELDSGAMLLDLIEAGASAGGSMAFEASPTAHDVIFEAALRGTRSAVVATVPGDAAITFSTPTATVTDARAFGTVEVGQWLLFRGWSNSSNNGWKRVATNPDEDTITITDASMVAEGAGGSGTIDGQLLTNGTEKRSFSIEETYTDREIYRLFNGQRVSTLSLDFTAGSILTGSFATMGVGASMEDPGTGVDPTWLGSGARAAKSTLAVLNATSNVGGVYVDGSLSSACFKAVSLNIDNQLRSVQCVGSKYSSSIEYGQQRVSGSLTKLFNVTTLYNAMLNHSDLSLAFGAYNADGGIHIHVPRVKLGSDGVGLGGGNNSDVDEVVDWTALRSADGTHQIQVNLAGESIYALAGVLAALSDPTDLLHYWAPRDAATATP